MPRTPYLHRIGCTSRAGGREQQSLTPSYSRSPWQAEDSAFDLGANPPASFCFDLTSDPLLVYFPDFKHENSAGGGLVPRLPMPSATPNFRSVVHTYLPGYKIAHARRVYPKRVHGLCCEQIISALEEIDVDVIFSVANSQLTRIWLY